VKGTKPQTTKKEGKELKNLPRVFYFTEHRIHESVSLVAYFKCIDLSILELNIAILRCMFSEIKNAV
jgi:hypothetical protein